MYSKSIANCFFCPAPKLYIGIHKRKFFCPARNFINTCTLAIWSSSAPVSIGLSFLKSGFFYYVFKFEQTATYYARLDVVVLREFYPTFDSITIFAELPLGQGIFFSCVVQNRKGSSEVFFHKPIYILTLLSCSIVFCNV